MASKRGEARVVVVTGAARGIGLATAQWFLAADYRVALLDIDRKELARTGRRLKDAKRVMALACDVSDPRQVKSAAARIARGFGRIDALVNNAGIAIFKPILEARLEDRLEDPRGSSRGSA